MRRALPLCAALVATGVALLSTGALGAAAPRAHVTTVRIARTTVTIAWKKVPGAKGYALYKNSKLLLRTPHTKVTFTNLRCGWRYKLAIRPFAWSKKLHFTTVSRRVHTRACKDSRAPTKPAGLEILRRTVTTLSVIWKPAKDNVKVVGYRIGLTRPRATAFWRGVQRRRCPAGDRGRHLEATRRTPSTSSAAPPPTR